MQESAPARQPRSPAPDPELMRFEALLDRCERMRARALGFDELRELSRLYRVNGARLARLRDRDADPDAIRHLNALCVRAYGFLYSAAPADHGPRAQRREWASGIPAALARTARAQLVAWSLLAAGAVLGFALAAGDPAALYVMLPTGFGYSPDRIDRLRSSEAARVEFLERDEVSAAHNTFFGSALFAHNTQVGLLSFATGMLAGIPTAMLQLYNGLMLGAFASLFLRGGPMLEFAAWILPHAIPELTAITLCCAAGLLLGAAVAAPGRRRRREALREAASPALLLFACAVPLFLLAALVESFIRESMLGTAPRLALATLLLACLLGAALALHRHTRPATRDTLWLRESFGD